MSKVLENAGMLLQEEKFSLVKKIAKAGDSINKHNHPEANVLFTPVKGKVRIFLDDTEEYLLTPGKILNFDGNRSIHGEFLEDSEVFVTLILK